MAQADSPLGTEVRRDDGELLGYVRPTDDGRWAGIAVFGGTIATRPTVAAARALVLEDGLASLADRWFHRPAADGDWQVVSIQEAWPGRAIGVVGLYALPGAAWFEVTAADLAAGAEMTREPPDGADLSSFLG
jgi:hypothetical protein